MQSNSELIQPIKWHDQQLQLLDQRLLPTQQVWLSFDNPEEVSQAIRDMVVRGAPAIGITAAYAVVLIARQAWSQAAGNWKELMSEPMANLVASRPTAVNLAWAIEQMTTVYLALPDKCSPEAALLDAAVTIHQQDIINNQIMGQLGAELLAAESRVLTHCNAGALATGGFGTALGVIRHGYHNGKIRHVYIDETRPWLQGSRLTAWELMQDNIPCTLQADVAAATLMASGKVDWIIVGADRIAANGDVANKIGTYSLAVLARHHNIKMMVVAPLSTIDWQIGSGQSIPIEQRSSCEVTHFASQQSAPDKVVVFNPAFDVTPAQLIDAIVTEAGVVWSPSSITMKTLRESY